MSKKNVHTLRDIWLEPVEQGTGLCLLSLGRRCCNLLLAAAQGQVAAALQTHSWQDATPSSPSLHTVTACQNTNSSSSINIVGHVTAAAAIATTWRVDCCYYLLKLSLLFLLLLVLLLFAARVLGRLGCWWCCELSYGYIDLRPFCHFSLQCVYENAFIFMTRPRSLRCLSPSSSLPLVALWCGKFLWN